MRRSFPAWLAILALSLQALWPLLAHARPEAAKLLVPVCTIDGVTHFVELEGSASPVEKRSATYHEHCKLCVFTADRPAAVAAAPLPVLRVDVPVFVMAAPAAADYVSSHSAPPAPPRAPPVLS